MEGACCQAKEADPRLGGDQRRTACTRALKLSWGCRAGDPTEATGSKLGRGHNMGRAGLGKRVVSPVDGVSCWSWLAVWQLLDMPVKGLFSGKFCETGSL